MIFVIVNRKPRDENEIVNSTIKKKKKFARVKRIAAQANCVGASNEIRFRIPRNHEMYTVGNVA